MDKIRQGTFVHRVVGLGVPSGRALLLMVGVATVPWDLPASRSDRGSIHGRVVEERTGRSVSGAYVHVSGTLMSSQSDSSGRYVLEDVPTLPVTPAPTSYDAPDTVVARRLGYYPEQRLLVVLDGEAAELDFYMRRDPRRVESHVAPPQEAAMHPRGFARVSRADPR